jgi:transglutaminase-like putative cysteine protease
MNRRDFRERMAPSMLVGLSPGRCRSTALPVSRTELDYFLQPSRFVPTDGIVKQTALKATAGATTDIQKARAIYQRVAENTFRDPKIRGCGRGDIRFMLESGSAGLNYRENSC